MKNRLAVFVVLASCLFSAALPKRAWAADPSDRYSDAFVLIQQGQAAEEKSDLATAYHKYRMALDILHGIRTDSPDWNAQMVEYRLKDCQSHFDAVKAKLPEPPAAPAAERPSIMSSAVAAPTDQAAPLPPAPVVKAVLNDESAKLRAQADKLQTENNQLKSDLAEAKRAAKSSAQVDKLAQENKDLKDQLAAAQKKATAKAAAPAESPELKKLRADADSARAEADKARKASSDLERKNADLNSQIAAAKKQSKDSADAKSADMKRLRTDLDKARAEADAGKKSAAQVADLQKQNKNLNEQLATAEKKAATPSSTQADSTELKKLRADLADARSQVENGKKATARVAELEKQNKDLNAQVASSRKEASAKVVPVPTGDSGELKKLRADLDSARADAAQSKKNAARAADLEKENKDLSAKLATAEKKANVPPADSGQVKSLRADLDKSRAESADLKKQLAAKPSGDSAEMKNLRAQLTDTRKELDQAKKSAGQVAGLEKQNKDLSAKLADAEKKAAIVKPSTAAPADTAELKKLRDQLDAARADVDKGKKASARVADLEKQNADLSSKLAAEKKAAATVAATEPPDARVMKRLRDENSYLRNLLDTYAAQNPELKGRLLRHDQNQGKSGQ